jgi:hypothetical protein
VLPDQHGEPSAIKEDSGVRLAVVFVALTVFVLGTISFRVLLVAAVDGVSGAVILVPPILAGLWLVPLFRLGNLPLRWHFLLASSLGLGLTAVLVLLLGLAGVLQRTVWIGLLGAFAVAGSIRLRGLLVERGRKTTQRRSDQSVTPATGERYLWLVLVPFLILALLAASNTPGFLWAEEGNGYDVLEYHLQIPKEYFQAGRIAYAPHNVYANFPMNVEMFYLLAMIVHNETYDVGTTANMIHLMLGALAVFAVWVIGREYSPTSGRIGAVAAGSVGWLGYLSGLAYVENGMLFFAATAVAALLRAFPSKTQPVSERDPETASRIGSVSRRWLGLAGLCSGFVCGCKYTGVPMVTLALTLAIIPWMYGEWRRRVLDLCVFVGAATLSFAPWLIKNEVMTGNPVFPLSNQWFRASPPGWGEQQTEQWNRGHRLPDVDRSLVARFRTLWRHVPADKDQRFGPGIVLIALGGLFGRRRERVDGILLGVLVVQLMVWLFATHLYARFAVPLLIPLGILAGRSVMGTESWMRYWIVLSVLVVGGAWNFSFAARLNGREAPGGAPASLIYDGLLPGYEYFAAVNHELPTNAKLLVVGEARAFYFQRWADYCVVFNQSPFVHVVETSDVDGVLQWLGDRGYTHVLVHWNEINRLARTYGFSSKITPDLFDRLTRAGLRRAGEFPSPHSDRRWVELYEVPERLEPVPNGPQIREDGLEQ